MFQREVWTREIVWNDSCLSPSYVDSHHEVNTEVKDISSEISQDVDCNAICDSSTRISEVSAYLSYADGRNSCSTVSSTVEVWIL